MMQIKGTLINPCSFLPWLSFRWNRSEQLFKTSSCGRLRLPRPWLQISVAYCWGLSQFNETLTNSSEQAGVQLFFLLHSPQHYRTSQDGFPEQITFDEGRGPGNEVLSYDTQASYTEQSSSPDPRGIEGESLFYLIGIGPDSWAHMTELITHIVVCTDRVEWLFCFVPQSPSLPSWSIVS